jgi:hypothetical protein
VLLTLVFLSLPPLSAVLVKWAGLSGRGTFLYEALLLACLGVVLPHGLKSLFVTPLLAVTLAAIGLAKAGVDSDFAPVIAVELVKQRDTIALLGFGALAAMAVFWMLQAWSLRRALIASYRRVCLVAVCASCLLSIAWLTNQTVAAGLFGSVTHGLTRGIANYAPLFGTNVSTPLRPEESALGTYVQRAAPAKHLLLLVVESGDIAPITDNESLRRLISRHPDQIELLGSGTVPFDGSTIHGEFRELCGLSIRSIDLSSPPECATLQAFTQAGYSLSAWHGYSGFFYRRDVWWSRIGFGANTAFREGFDGESGCTRYFRGACDRVVVEKALEWLFARPKGLAYVLTLDTHFPLSPGRLMHPGAEGLDCMAEPICLIAQHITGTVDLIRSTVNARAETVDVVLVGDHAFPKAGYPTHGQVGYVVLRLDGTRNANAAPPASSYLAKTQSN